MKETIEKLIEDLPESWVAAILAIANDQGVITNYEMAQLSSDNGIVRAFDYFGRMNQISVAASRQQNDETVDLSY